MMAISKGDLRAVKPHGKLQRFCKLVVMIRNVNSKQLKTFIRSSLPGPRLGLWAQNH